MYTKSTKPLPQTIFCMSVVRFCQKNITKIYESPTSIQSKPPKFVETNKCLYFHKTAGISSILVFVKSINGHLAKFSVPSISKVFEKIHSGAEPVTRFQTTKCHQSKFLWLIQFLCKGLRNSCSIVPKFDNTKKSPNKYIKKRILYQDR